MNDFMSSFEQYNVGGDPDKNSPSKGFESVEGRNVGQYPHFHGKGVWEEAGNTDCFSSDYGFYDNTAEDRILWSKSQQQQQQQLLLSEFGILDELHLDIVSPPFQSCNYEGINTELDSFHAEDMLLDEPEKEKPSAIPLASLGILKNHGSGFRRLNGERVKVPSYGTECTEPQHKVDGQKLSTKDILRLAGKKFIQSSSQRIDDFSTLSHPFGSSFLGLSGEETKDVELVQDLLASAEKVGHQQYDRASKLLSRCENWSSDTGNPVQRLVYYFSEALREKIDRETGRIGSKGLGMKQSERLFETMASPNLAALKTFHQELPFSQVCMFSGMQAIIESVADAKKVHLIALDIRNGIQCTALMQALVGRFECPLELLKITAVGTTAKSTIEETGERLTSFAQSMNIPFSFRVVFVSDMLDLKEDLLDLKADETVAMDAKYSLWPMLSRPDRLEYLMRLLRRINPCVMVVTEVEANLNSPVFVNRFIEALFFFGAYFDCFADCMDQYDPSRKIAESMYQSPGMRNSVAAEGEERMIRHVKIGVWRAFFARFGMMEEELSTSSLLQADLLVKNFARGSSCTIEMDGKSLIVGWKGTPLNSVSAWKFT